MREREIRRLLSKLYLYNLFSPSCRLVLTIVIWPLFVKKTDFVNWALSRLNGKGKLLSEHPRLGKTRKKPLKMAQL
jgi:hypothetical protein